MKFNLKNRPTAFALADLKLVKIEEGKWMQICPRLNEWFEGFEKELREIRKQTQKKTSPNLVRIDDILGEEGKE